MKSKVGLVLISLNEEAALKQICPQLVSVLSQVPELEYIFVDGGSSDRSIEVFNNFNLKFIVQSTRGMRGAIFDGTRFMLSKAVDSILYVQTDGNCLIEKIPTLIRQYRLTNADMLIASRYKDDARSHDDTLISKFGNLYFTFLISKLSGFKYTDALVGFRMLSSKLIYKSEILNDNKYNFLEKLFNTSLGIDPLISTIAPLLGAKILELPVDEPPRIGGEVKKQTLRWGLGYTFQVLYFGVKLRLKSYRGNNNET